MRILVTLLALCHAAAPAEPAPAAPPQPGARELARAVQAFYERTRDLEASFVQTYRYAAAGRSQVSRGTLRVKKPGRMRWDYQAPERKTVAVVGSRLVQWEPGVPTDPESMRFPHLYGPLPLAAVVEVTAFLPGPDGSFAPLTAE